MSSHRGRRGASARPLGQAGRAAAAGASAALLAAAGIAATGAAAAGAAVRGAAAGPGAGPQALYVSPRGSDRNPCTRTAPCRTIARAVRLAARGATVLVAHGTYREEVKVTKDIAIVGQGRPVLDAAGKANGFLLAGPGAAGSTVRGFVVELATFEGILAQHTSDVTIAGNVVKDNDQGLKAKHPVGECAPLGPIPGDCGEGLHLMSVTQATVTSNLVEDNAGGILLTDELGPTALNLIASNRTLDNVLDCGITLAGHSTAALSATGALQPAAGGVYANLVTGNVSDGNGTKGQGGGILLAAGAPGSAVYDNVVDGNTADGNGLAGVTLHSHAPDQDLNGNVITGNSLSNDGLKGYPNGTPGDEDFGVTGTVGILVASAVSPLSGIEIAGNTISDVHYGIWTKNVPPISLTANTFTNVAVPLMQT
jgi:hypothetical protein